MLDVKFTNLFKKDYKLIQKRGLKIDKLHEVINTLRQQEPLPAKNRDHALTGNYLGFRECHVEPDWLLIYQIKDDELILLLSRTGSHSDLF